MINEDTLRARYDDMATHTDPMSPYYDGPLEDVEEFCRHGVCLDEDCPECQVADIARIFAGEWFALEPAEQTRERLEQLTRDAIGEAKELI